MIDGKNIKQYYGSPQLMSSVMGYCPQISPIDPEMTVKEKLVMLGRMKGMDYNLAVKYAKLTAKKFEMFQFFNTYADKLSGGN